MRLISVLLALCVVCACDASDRKGRSRAAEAWATASAVEPVKPAVTPAANIECREALDEVNTARAAKGMPALIHDPLLSQAAYACAKERAAGHIAGHLASDFAHLPTGAKADSAGCAALEPSWGWQSCCWDDPGYTHAGAAWVMGSDGRRYMHIFVRNEVATAKSSEPVVYQTQTTYRSSSSAGTCSSGSCGTTYSSGRRSRR